MQKSGNYLNGMFYGKRISYENITRIERCNFKDTRYKGFCDIEEWRIRNLMVHGNCLIKGSIYTKLKKQFEALFCKKNIVLQPSDKGFMIITINEEAKKHAYPYVTEYEEKEW